MMVAMRSHDVQDEMQEGFEPAPLPPIAADGAPVLTPIESVPPPRPSLCRAGPCKNYHCFQIQTDSEDPRPVKVPGTLPPGTPRAFEVPDGTLYRSPRSFHVETHHYCYPTTGVEMKLGSLPVITCNRWHPFGATTPSVDRADFLASEAGIQYAQEVAQWERDREQEQEVDQEIQSLIETRQREAATNQPGETP